MDYDGKFVRGFPKKDVLDATLFGRLAGTLEPLNDRSGNLRLGTLKRELVAGERLVARERRFGVEVALPEKVRRLPGGTGAKDAHLRNLLQLPSFKDDGRFRQLLGLDPFELGLGDVSRRRLETTQDLVLACKDMDRAMLAVFGRNIDLLEEVAELVTTNADRENLGVNFLENRIQQMLKVFYVRMSAASSSEGVTTDMSVEGEWRGMWEDIKGVGLEGRENDTPGYGGGRRRDRSRSRE